MSIKSTIVLDTNAVLAWLVFRDARLEPLTPLLLQGQVQWLATPAMRAEFDHVLARAPIQAWQPDAAALAQAWLTHAQQMPLPERPAPWRCRDHSDQMFLDLACAYGAQALLTRDRSLLVLGRRAKTLGLAICAPEQWLAAWPA